MMIHDFGKFNRAVHLVHTLQGVVLEIYGVFTAISGFSRPYRGFHGHMWDFTPI